MAFWRFCNRPLSCSFGLQQLHAVVTLLKAELTAVLTANTVECCCFHGMQVGQAAAAIEVPKFEPRKGVQIETDPTATTVKSSLGSDDRAITNGLISQLEVGIHCAHELRVSHRL